MGLEEKRHYLHNPPLPFLFLPLSTIFLTTIVVVLIQTEVRNGEDGLIRLAPPLIRINHSYIQHRRCRHSSI